MLRYNSVMATPAQHIDSTYSPIFCRIFDESLPDILRIAAEPVSAPWTSITPWHDAVFKSEFQNPCSMYFGARLDGELIGFLVLHLVIDEAHILNFCIQESMRGVGIGRNFLEYVIEHLKENGGKRITLEVKRSNLVAQNLYASMFFTEVGVRERYYTDTQEDAIVMSHTIR